MQAPKGTSSPEFPISWLFFFQSPSVVQGRDKGLGAESSKPSAPLPASSRQGRRKGVFRRRL